MHLFNKPILLGLFLTFSLFACHSPEAIPSPSEQAQVEIDITSGLPSPKWELAPPEIEVLEQTLLALPAASPTPFFDGLGYRGFVITISSPERRIRVQDGHVLVEEAGVAATFVDSNNQLEKWLLSLSKSHVEPQLFAYLEEAIGK
jgi:hypothetical protein